MNIQKMYNHKIAKSYGFFAHVLVPVVFLTSCSVKDYDTYEERPAEELYKEAEDLYKQKSYVTAAKAYAEVERQHPYSNLAVTSQIKAADSYYHAQKYDDAIDHYKMFIQLHPGHSNVAYALYMIGNSYYDQIPIIQRDQSFATNALEQFNELTTRFPSSEFAKKASERIHLIQDHLAGKEMDVGRYYLRQKSYIAALNRFEGVVKDHKKSNHTPEAMYRIVESYLGLGLINEAQEAASTLQQEFAKNAWALRAKNLVASAKKTNN